MSINHAALELGSNIDPEKNINEAIDILTNELTHVIVSGLLRTKPVGFIDQADFINVAVAIDTGMDLEELKMFCNGVEKQLGRVRTENKYGPRTIDLDIIVWNGKIINDDYYQRDFVRQTINEVVPGLMDK